MDARGIVRAQGHRSGLLWTVRDMPEVRDQPLTPPVPSGPENVIKTQSVTESGAPPCLNLGNIEFNGWETKAF